MELKTRMQTFERTFQLKVLFIYNRHINDPTFLRTHRKNQSSGDFRDRKSESHRTAAHWLAGHSQQL
jgi:hypothetical protein